MTESSFIKLHLFHIFKSKYYANAFSLRLLELTKKYTSIFGQSMSECEHCYQPA
jgi:hypothetical protein